MRKAVVPYDLYDYLGYWQGRGYEDEADKMALKKLLSQIPQKNSLIDVGGGFGRLAEIYAPEFKKCLLIDPSQKLLAQAKKRLKNYPHIEIKEGKVEKIPAPDGEFDVALLIRIAHHFPDLLPVFKEIKRVLRPGGFLILEFANKIHFLARVRAWLKGDFKFTKNLQTTDQRSPQSVAKGKIYFLNHHPAQIEKLLAQAGFEVKERLSVSNFRSPLVKKIIPFRILLFSESRFQLLASSFHFGPSIFLLCVKK